MRRFATLAATCLLVLGLTAVPAARKAADQPASVRAESAPSLSVTTVSVPEGTLRVYLPSDIAAGDTISGTVVAEPAGTGEAQRSENTSTLNGYVIDVGTQKSTVAHRAFTFVVPAASAAAALIVRRGNGAEVKRASIAVRPQPAQSNRRVIPSDFHFPQTVAAGQAFTVSGPFTGDVSKSALSVGGRPVEVIAESPRAFIASAPQNVSGPTTYQLKENGVAVTAACNVVKISLSAPVTRLTKGEHSVVHVEITGLDGIHEPVPLRIVNSTPGIVELAGGTTQELRIRPADVRAGGTYATERQITGVRAGTFSIWAASWLDADRGKVEFYAFDR